MSWIESHQELARHPKTKRLARVLQEPEVAVIGRLHCLWWWALDYADDGDLSRMDASDIADACQWDGDAEAFIAAMVQVRFLDQDSDGLRIHDWDDYAGRLVEKRRQNVERVKRWRADNETRTNGTVTNNQHAHVTHNESVGYTATVPDPTVPNSTGPEEVPLSAESGRAAPAATPSAMPKTDRLAQVIDLIRDADLEPNVRGQDTKAVKDCRASPADIAATYVAIARDEFGDNFTGLKLSIATACAHVDGWRARQQRQSHRPPPDGFLGASPRVHAPRAKGGIFG